MSVKRTVADLAVAGGRPAFAETLHVGRPNLGDRAAFMRRVETVLERRWLTNNGALVQEFERRIEAMVGVAYCVATCNATLALEIAAKACGLTGEVIVPAFTFIATAHALEWIGLTPVFCDIDPNTHNIDPAAAERAITSQTSGILGVQVGGRPCDVEGLSAVAGRNNLTLLFDAAHAFGCGRNGRMIGNFGAAEVFSFHATKFINTFEGGALVTNDEVIARRARLMRDFGFAGIDHVVSAGTNAKMNEMCAAMGLTSLDSFDDIVRVNQRHYEQYRAALESCPGLRITAYDPTERCNYQYVVLEIDEAAAGLSRDDLRDVLWAEHVRARRYFFPGCHRHEPYASRPRRGTLEHTDRLCGRVLSLPSGTAVTAGDVAAVCSIVSVALANSAVVRVSLDGHRLAATVR